MFAAMPVASRLDSARSVADAVLYEGYLLYPYRKSSLKNRVRWQFGVVAPRAWVEAQEGSAPSVTGAHELWCQQTQVLVEARPDTQLEVAVRFLQLETRAVERRRQDGHYEQVAEWDVGGSLHLTFDEAAVQERGARLPLSELLAGGARIDLSAPELRSVELLAESGQEVGRVVRSRQAIAGEAEIKADRVPAPFPLIRVTLRVVNTDTVLTADAERPAILPVSMIGAHTLLCVSQGSFLSLVDPPAWATSAAASCVNLGAFPVLAGPPGATDAVLSSPIILYDHPGVAPESPGDLFDAAEIDEILSLRALTLTDAEKAEARATDPRAADLLERVDRLPHEVFARLHGAIRSLAPAAPTTEVLTVRGVRLAEGSKVILRPRRRGSDAQDMFVSGRLAIVEEVLQDVNGRRFLAVTLADDPRRDVEGGPGRVRHFTPDEVEPVETAFPTLESETS